MASTLYNKYGWTLWPLICNAPMGGFAGDALALETAKAGGFGLIGAALSMSDLESQLENLKRNLPKTLHRNYEVDSERLPIGVGLLCFAVKKDEAIAVLKKHKPAVVWLYAAKNVTDYADWVQRIRKEINSDIWIQTGSVSDARTIAKACNPDVLTLQGGDAGGHGMEQAAGIISLLPEVSDALAKDGFADIPLLAAGGIADGRGVAASLVLGASGVVMGTRFLASSEVILPHPLYADTVLAASDGGHVTVRSKVFDDLNPSGNVWPVTYDGRAIRNLTYKDSVNGVEIERNRDLHQKAQKGEDGGFAEESRRATIWAGTGVGLVHSTQQAATIVEETREAAKKLLAGAAKSHI